PRDTDWGGRLASGTQAPARLTALPGRRTSPAKLKVESGKWKVSLKSFHLLLWPPGPVPFRYSFVNFSFSRHTNSMSSVSTRSLWLTLTVHGRVYALGSSIVTSISRVPKFGRRNR